MKFINRVAVGCVAAFLAMGAAYAAGSSKYQDTITLFKNAGKSSVFFDKSYAYAVFPTVGEGALGVGAAHGKGHVYIHGKWVGDVSMTELSVGLQAGGKAFSQMIFFQDKRALDDFESGSFEFGADAGVVAITASAEAGASTEGSGSGVSGGMKDAVLRGEYYKGMAVFAIPKGGLMGNVSVAGQKFSYSPREQS
jgi:lipid-binding SYLF domain-containing protein